MVVARAPKLLTVRSVVGGVEDARTARECTCPAAQPLVSMAAGQRPSSFCGSRHDAKQVAQHGELNFEGINNGVSAVIQRAQIRGMRPASRHGGVGDATRHLEGARSPCPAALGKPGWPVQDNAYPSARPLSWPG